MEVIIGNQKIWFSESVIRVLSQKKQLSFKKHEMGGILIGKIYTDTLSIKKITLPNKFDESGPRFFERNKDIAQIILDYEFTNSNGSMVYLGEWHTHAEKDPSPSGTDIEMIKKQLRENIIHSDKILLVINGIKSLYIGLCNKKGLNGTQINT